MDLQKDKNEATLVVNKQFLLDVGLVASIINSNLFDDIINNERFNNNIDVHYWIGEIALEFVNHHIDVKDYGWEKYCLKNDYSDFEEVVYLFAENKLKKIDVR